LRAENLIRAAHLAGAVQSIVSHAGRRPSPFVRRRHEQNLAELRKAAGDAGFARHVDEGASLRFTDAISYALATESEQT